MGLYSEHSRHLIGEFWKLGLGLINPFLRKKKIRYGGRINESAG
jgi:hypothetical protein